MSSRVVQTSHTTDTRSHCCAPKRPSELTVTETHGSCKFHITDLTNVCTSKHGYTTCNLSQEHYSAFNSKRVHSMHHSSALSWRKAIYTWATLACMPRQQPTTTTKGQHSRGSELHHSTTPGMHIVSVEIGRLVGAQCQLATLFRQAGSKLFDNCTCKTIHPGDK